MRQLLLPLFLLSAGCAGARSSIVIPASTYPVSLSSGMRAPDGHLLDKPEMEVVGKFHGDRTAWGLLYSLVPLTPHLDLSDEVNAQVKAAGGQAVVRLRTETRPCALDYFVILSILPIWPGCASVKVDGDIIRYKPLVPASAPAPVAGPSLPDAPEKKADQKPTSPGLSTTPRAAASPAPPSARACQSHLDCKTGLVCPQGKCVSPVCVADRDCGSGRWCSLEGSCESGKVKL